MQESLRHTKIALVVQALRHLGKESVGPHEMAAQSVALTPRKSGSS
ncbi:MAG TPA: hypothetical protein VKB88_33110 [Bryobacteraceae bacterium]|nr:hypothetical protein [Bryobacteraceae bacterium]